MCYMPEYYLLFIGVVFTLCFVAFSGGHIPDVCDRVRGSAWQTSVPSGTLHRGRLHQIQLELRLCGGEPETHTTGKTLTFYNLTAQTIIPYIGNAHIGNAHRLRSSLLSALFSHRLVHTTPLGGYRHIRK